MSLRGCKNSALLYSPTSEDIHFHQIVWGFSFGRKKKKEKMEGMSPKITGNDPNLSSELPFALPIDGK